MLSLSFDVVESTIFLEVFFRFVLSPRLKTTKTNFLKNSIIDSLVVLIHNLTHKVKVYEHKAIYGERISQLCKIMRKHVHNLWPILTEVRIHCSYVRFPFPWTCILSSCCLTASCHTTSVAWEFTHTKIILLCLPQKKLLALKVKPYY